jgi:membrane protease YdiL (CAAX protease family)
MQLLGDAATVPIVISVAVVCYTIHHYLGIEFFRRRLEARGVTAPAREIWAVLLQRGTGVILLGIVPVIITTVAVGGSAADYGLTLQRPWISLGVAAAGALTVLVPCALFLKRSPGLLRYYPEIRIRHWPISLVVANTASWFVYLAAYELFFRGILVARLAPEMGVWTAIFVSSAMYALVHLPKHPIECAVVIPGGVLFAAATTYTGSILSAYLAHAVLASGAELLAVRATAERASGDGADVRVGRSEGHPRARTLVRPGEPH